MLFLYFFYRGLIIQYFNKGGHCCFIAFIGVEAPVDTKVCYKIR